MKSLPLVHLDTHGGPWEFVVRSYYFPSYGMSYNQVYNLSVGVGLFNNLRILVNNPPTEHVNVVLFSSE
jgi:hypothetical protein